MTPDYFVHHAAIVEPGATIGPRTRVWAFAHVLGKARIGADCNICDHTFIENDVVVGDRVTIKCGVQLWDGIRLEDDVFVGPNATFTNDRFPRSKQYPGQWPVTVVEKGASIGANATILPGIRIGRSAMVGAGAVVTRDVPANAIVVGNPARITGYSGLASPKQPNPPLSSSLGDWSSRSETGVRGVRRMMIKTVRDIRGDLTVAEWARDLPFVPRRVFFVSNVSSSYVRGEHAHRECHQYLVCLGGSITVLADDGREREEFLLDHPSKGLYLPPMVWGVQYRHSHGAVLAVFASHEYDSNDYIREYEKFLAEVNK